ncbi:MAG: CoA transferase [Lachnospiraceae bacterium]|nr:CoA transferase [Lachnospiraceae bacterium]
MAAGDPWRLTGISYGPSRFSHDENPVFDIYNAGKKFISVNLKTEEENAIFHRLLSQSDIFLTNNREAALRRLHVSYEDLKEQYPAMIFTQVTGFGAADATAFPGDRTAGTCGRPSFRHAGSAHGAPGRTVWNLQRGFPREALGRMASESQRDRFCRCQGHPFRGSFGGRAGDRERLCRGRHLPEREYGQDAAGASL